MKFHVPRTTFFLTWNGNSTADFVATLSKEISSYLEHLICDHIAGLGFIQSRNFVAFKKIRDQIKIETWIKMTKKASNFYQTKKDLYS